MLVQRGIHGIERSDGNKPCIAGQLCEQRCQTMWPWVIFQA
jgi:hypothetical protein